MTTGIARNDDVPMVGGFSADVVRPVGKGAPHVVRIVREAWREDDVAFGRVFWSVPVVSAREAACMVRWLASDPDRLTGWGRLAAVHGAEALTAIVTEAWSERWPVIRDNERSRREREREERVLRAGRRDLDRTWNSRHAISFYRRCDDEPFALLRFDDKTTRDRVWDFVGQSTDEYARWRRLVLDEGELAFERMLFAEMMRVEALVKKAGLGAGGRRPLRLWRGEPR